MTWPTVPWRRLGPTARRRLVLHLCAIAVVLLARLPLAQPAHADTMTTCILTPAGLICPHYPPPDLLDLNQSLYAATPAQAASLQILESQAISDVITLHSLSPADVDAVQSWGRADAEAELFSLLLRALNTPAASRTADQQNAVDWLAAIDQRQAIAAAEAAGLKYVKWAGLDQSKYQALLNSHASESDLQSFLSATPDNYNNPDIGLATGGYCVYRSPAPYSTEYTGYTDVTCTSQCPFICNPPTPSYEQFVKWGEADANYPWLTAPGFGSTEISLAQGLGVGLPLAAIAQAAPIGDVVAAQLARQAAFDAIDAAVAGASEGTAGGATVAAEGATAIEEGVAEGVSLSAEGTGAVSVVLVALVTAIIEGITVANNAKLPGQLATLITGAQSATYDPAALESTSNGASLFSLFVGATLPVPRSGTCDNSIFPAGAFLVTVGGMTRVSFNTPCLNAPAIPAASDTDPLFQLQAKGATALTASRTITWTDTAAGTTTTARLSGNWFIEQANGATVQTLRLVYTDWNGAERTAWLLGGPTDGYAFVTLTSSSTATDPDTCLADGTCSYGRSIDYVGPDGQDYSASVQTYTPPTGAPSYSTAVEGSPVTFNGNNFAPASATGPITYRWEFQQTGCGNSSGFGDIKLLPLCVNWDNLAQIGIYPDYTAPVTGTTATYTYPTTGQYLVRLTATDATGTQAVDTFTVNVADAPPALALTPACPLASPCVSQTGDVGTATALGGTITHAGTGDTELVLVNWGDGSSEDMGSAGADPTLSLGPTPSP